MCTNTKKGYKTNACKESSYLGEALLTSLKSTHVRIWPPFFLTGYMFTNQPEHLTSSINLAFNNVSIFFFDLSCNYWPILLHRLLD